MFTLAAGPQAIALAKLAYAADLPLLFTGSHGIGKSELLAQDSVSPQSHYQNR